MVGKVPDARERICEATLMCFMICIAVVLISSNVRREATCHSPAIAFIKFSTEIYLSISHLPELNYLCFLLPEPFQYDNKTQA